MRIADMPHVERPGDGARIVYDDRWNGAHGIGRFTAQLTARIPMIPLGIKGHSTSLLGPLRLALGLRQFRSSKLFFSPGYIPPWPDSPIPFVLTLHDLNHIDLPSNAAKRAFYRHVLKPACRKAAAILTGSEFSRKRILDWTALPSERVLNVSYGVSAGYCVEGSAHDEGVPYFLVVGIRKPHKNHENIIRAFARSRAGGHARLLFTGVKVVELDEVIRENSVEPFVKFLGNVTDAELAALYRGAQALLFPSFYEGFGLPVIEAMACGCPVITSNVTALPEVAGDAAIMVNPADVGELAQAIDRMLENQELRFRLSRAGIVRAGRFRWEDVATRVRNVCDSIG